MDRLLTDRQAELLSAGLSALRQDLHDNVALHIAEGRDEQAQIELARVTEVDNLTGLIADTGIVLA